MRAAGEAAYAAAVLLVKSVRSKPSLSKGSDRPFRRLLIRRQLGTVLYPRRGLHVLRDQSAIEGRRGRYRARDLLATREVDGDLSLGYSR